jgi:large subunit ribosomal protein L23
MDPYDIILHPYVTEKTMNQMDKNNALEFIVKRSADKGQIKRSIEEMFESKVKKINTRITKNGKHAIVTFTDDVNAEDIGMRIGIF